MAETLVRGPHREWILGDLEEMHAARWRRTGPLRAHASYAAWVARTAFTSAGRTLVAGIRGDLRMALRQVALQPRIHLLGSFILAVGLGVGTFVWGIHYGSFERGLPVSEPDRMLAVEAVGPDGEPDFYFSVRELELVQDADVFEQVGLWRTSSVTFDGEGGPPERLSLLELSPSVFELLEVRSAVGRLLLPEDAAAGGTRVAVLGHRFWTRRYGGNPDIVGRTIRLDGRPVEIVGVLPEGRSLLNGQQHEQLYLPVTAREGSSGRHYRMIGRGPVGVDAEAVSAPLGALGRALSALRVEEGADAAATTPRLRAVPFTHSFRNAQADVFGRVLALVGTLLFLLAVANVSNLFLVRAMTRSRETAVRKALGAGGFRILRHLALEAAVPAALGIVGGALLASAALRWYQRSREIYAGGQLATWYEYQLTVPHLAILAAAALASTVMVSLIVGVMEIRGDSVAALRSGRRSTGSLRLARGLVGLEVAAAGALALLAGLMIRSAWNLRTAEWGFATEGITTGHVVLDPARYATAEARAGFWEALERDLGALRGAESVALATQLPMIRYGGPTWEESRRIEIEGRPTADPGELPVHYLNAVSPDYFATFGVRLRSGRGLPTEGESASGHAVVVNRPFVQRYLQGQDPLGRRIRIWTEGEPGPWRTVTGVAPDLWMDADEARRPEGLYVPLSEAAPLEATFAVGSAGIEGGLFDEARGVVASLDPQLPVVDVRSMDAVIQERTRSYGRDAPLFITLGAGALLLALVGMYVVVSYVASLRTAELGIRAALGAGRAGLVMRSMREVVLPTLVGGAAGLAVGLVVVRGFARFIFQVDPLSPSVAGVVFLSVVGAALGAALIPAVRAGRTDPLVLLRTE